MFYSKDTQTSPELRDQLDLGSPSTSFSGALLGPRVPWTWPSGGAQSLVLYISIVYQDGPEETAQEQLIQPSYVQTGH